jgi:hypothetical protein
MQQLRQSAVQRILGATKNKPIRNFRELLLSRLASQAPQSDGLSDLMLQHVLGDYHANRGHLLVVRWLYALAAALAAQKVDGSAAPAAAAAGEDALQGDGAATAAAAAGEMEGVEEEQEVADAADKQNKQHQQQEVQGADADIDMEEADGEAVDSPDIQQQQQQQQVDRQQNHPTGLKGSSSKTGSTGTRIGSNSSSSSEAVQEDLSGTQYEAVLISVLQGLQQQLPASDPAIQRLLQDAPVLPLHATLQFLQQLLQQGSSWAVLALDCAYALIEGRPPMRQQLLQLVLQAGVADEAAVREHAVRLLVSQLLRWEIFAGEIVAFAQAQLLLLLEPRKLLAARQRAKQEQTADEQQQQLVNDAAGSMADAEQQQQQQEGAEQPGVKQEAAAAGGAAGAQDQQQQAEAEPELDVEVAAQQCMLFMSLCASKPELMRMLLDTYGKAGEACCGV